MALGIKAGDEVITPTYSFFATAGAIVRVGARPVLVDIDPATFNIDPAQAAAAITPRTKAIMPVHLFGLSADLDPILDAADRAPASRSSRTPRRRSARPTSRAPVGGIGAFGCFSFFPEQESRRLRRRRPARRPTTTALAERARLLRTHGMEPKYYHHLVGAQLPDGRAAGGGAARQGAAPCGLDRGAPARTPRATAPVRRRRPRRASSRCRSSRRTAGTSSTSS